MGWRDAPEVSNGGWLSAPEVQPPDTPTSSTRQGDSTFTSPYAYLDPSVQRMLYGPNRGSSLGTAVGNVLFDAKEDPVGTIKALPPAINRGVADLAGYPMDALLAAGNLSSMTLGYLQSKLTGKAPSPIFNPVSASDVPLTGDWLAGKADSTAAGPLTQNPSPNNSAARLLYGAGRAVPGAMTGRMAIANAAGGGAGTIVGEMGGDPASQALAGILGGQQPRPSPLRPPEMQTPFAKENMGAAAAAPDLTGVSPMLQDLIKQQAQKGPLNREVVNRRVEADRLPIPIRLTRGQASGDTALISQEMNSRGKHKELQDLYQEQNRLLVDNLDELRRAASPNVVHFDHIQNGQSLIDAYKQMDAPVREDIRAKYKALEEANGGKLPIDGAAFFKAADTALAQKLKTEFLPGPIERQMARLRDGGQMTFEQYEALRTNLAAEARKASRAGDGNAAMAVGLVRDALENMPMNGVPAQIKPLADAARNAARRRFQALEKDPAYRDAVDDPTPDGELSPFADDFVKKYVVNGKSANIRQMQENLRGNPLARETISAAALNYIKSKSGVNLYTNDGNFSHAGYNRALSELTPRLNQLVPADLAEKLQSLGNVARWTQEQPRGSYVNSSNTFVAAAADAAKSTLEGALNTASLGANLGSFVRTRREQSKERKFVEDALDPRAGLRE